MAATTEATSYSASHHARRAGEAEPTDETSPLRKGIERHIAITLPRLCVPNGEKESGSSKKHSTAHIYFHQPNRTQHGSTHMATSIHPSCPQPQLDKRERDLACCCLPPLPPSPQERMEGRTQPEEDMEEEKKRNSFTATEAMNEQTHLTGTVARRRARPFSGRRSSAPANKTVDGVEMSSLLLPWWFRLIDLTHSDVGSEREARCFRQEGEGSLYQMDSAERGDWKWKGRERERERERDTRRRWWWNRTCVVQSQASSPRSAPSFCACIFVCAAARRHDGDGISRSSPAQRPHLTLLWWGPTGANWRVGAGGQPVHVGPWRGRVGICALFGSYWIIKIQCKKSHTHSNGSDF
jgi:hypothetical protein